jgi:hypothetical protein
MALTKGLNVVQNMLTTMNMKGASMVHGKSSSFNEP